MICEMFLWGALPKMQKKQPLLKNFDARLHPEVFSSLVTIKIIVRRFSM